MCSFHSLTKICILHRHVFVIYVIIYFQIQSRRPPCSDFYKCSQVRLKPLEEDTFQAMSSSQLVVEGKTDLGEDFSSLNNAIELGFTLIILWQVMF